MKNNKESTRASRICQNFLIIAALFLVASINPAFGQERSTDRDNPTFIEGKGVLDKLDGSGDEYFYKLIIGQGKLSLSFRVTAFSTNAGATLDLYDANTSRAILSNVLVQGVDGGSQQVLKSVQLGKPRNEIIMRIKGIRYGSSGGTGTYAVGIEGNAAPPENGNAAAAAGSNRFTGELDGTENENTHTISITGPGKLTLIFDVKASGTNTGAYFELLDGSSRPIFSNILVQAIDRGSERLSKTVNLAKSQTLTLRVTGIRYGSSGGQGVYSVQLSGPVAID